MKEKNETKKGLDALEEPQISEKVCSPLLEIPRGGVFILDAQSRAKELVETILPPKITFDSYGYTNNQDVVIPIVGRILASADVFNALKHTSTAIGYVLVAGINLENRQEEIMAMREIPLQ